MNDDIRPRRGIWAISSKESGAAPYCKSVIVHADETHYWKIDINQKGGDNANGPIRRKAHYIKAPSKHSKSDLLTQVEAGKVRLQDFQLEGQRALPVAMVTDARPNEKHQRSISSRRKIEASVDSAKVLFELIRPLVERTRIEELVDVECVRAYAKSLERKCVAKAVVVIRAVRAYLIGGCTLEALLPAYDLCGSPGKPRYPRTSKDGEIRRPGRKNIAYQAGHHQHLAPPCTSALRSLLIRGYRKFKRSRKISVEQAYYLTLAEYFAESTVLVGNTVEVKLLPMDQLPTIAQFRRHGPGEDPVQAAARLNIGESRWRKNHRPLVSDERSNLRAAGEQAVIDSTSDDQNLVLSVDRTVLMPTSWNSKVLCQYTGYVAGIYSGFERPSTLTNLLAIGHAAQNKVEYCRRYGVQITEEDWMPLHFRRIRADNGELKSREGIVAMTSSEINIEFLRAYAADAKGSGESIHMQTQRGFGHQLPGSTMGNTHERGDENPVQNACMTHAEYMAQLIRWILVHNNVEPVPHLLTMEMRSANVSPTRAAILKWMIKVGYVCTEPVLAEDVRRRCLPRLTGKISRKGITVFDPTTLDSRIVPHLRYTSNELTKTVLAAFTEGQSQDIYVHMDIADLGRVWFEHKGKLIEAFRVKADPGLDELTLKEFIDICALDRLKLALARHQRLQIYSNEGKSRYDSAENSKRLTLAAKKAAGISKGANSKDISKSQAEEMEKKEESRRYWSNARVPTKIELSTSAAGHHPSEVEGEPDWVRLARLGNA